MEDCEHSGVDPVEYPYEQFMRTWVNNDAFESDRCLRTVDAHERVGLVVDRLVVEVHDESAWTSLVERRFALESDEHRATLVVERDRQHSVIGAGECEREIGRGDGEQ